MKGFVDHGSCIGCGVCESVSPEVFHMNDEGLADAIQGEIADADQEGAREAEESCPVGAIRFED